MSLTLPELIRDEVYPGMYRVRWEDGLISDIVNKTRVTETIRRYLERKGRIDSTMPPRASRKAVGAFK